MRVLETLSERSIGGLAMALELPGFSPARKLAPVVMEWWADCLAAEAGRRIGLDVAEPGFPDVATEELERAVVVFLGMADAEADKVAPELRAAECAAIRAVADGFLDILGERLLNAGPGH